MRALLNWLRRGSAERRLEAEFQFHLECESRKWVEAGCAPDEARARASASFGPVDAHKADVRQAQEAFVIETFVQDVRSSLRSFRRQPGFSVTAVLTLAVGIGANTAIFTIVDAAFFARYPLESPEQLVRLYGQDGQRNLLQLGFSAPKFQLLREQQTTFVGIDAATFLPFTLGGGAEPSQVNGASATSTFLQTFGARPLAGRFFLPQEERDPSMVVIGETLWRTRYGADPAVVGRVMTLDGTPRTIIGVAPRLPAFWDADVWTTDPFQFPGVDQDVIRRGFSYLSAVARLAPGVSEAQARGEIEVLLASYRAANPANADAAWTGATVPMLEDIVGATRSSIFALLAAVGLLMLVACSNVANLLLIRATSRRQEIGVRLALGASRGRIARQFLVESLVLSGLGAAAGAVLASWALPGLVALARNNLAFANDIHLNLAVLGATAVLAALTGVMIGAYPAAQGSQTDVVSSLRDGGRTVAGAPRAHRVRRLILTAQVAVSLVLLIGAGVLVTSFMKLRAQPPGFDPAQVFIAGISLPPGAYPDGPAQERFYARLADALTEAPGVSRATLAQNAPLGGPFSRAPYALAEGAIPPLNERPLGLTRTVLPGYFATLGIPLLAGRDFSERDGGSQPLVAIVSAATARRLAGEGGPVLGRRVIMGSQGGGQVMEVVGVVGDVRSVSLAQTPDVEFYRPVQQRGRPFMQMIVRTSGDAGAFQATARRVLSSLDPSLPLTGATTLEAVVEQSLAQQRLLFMVLAVFAALALVLSAVGIYGVVAWYVGQRTTEIGVRMAMGASRRQVVIEVLRQTLGPVALGLVAGVAVAAGLAQWVQGLLFEVSPLDPALLGASGATLALVSLAAAALPARRASRVSPAEAMRGA
jgi:predicted permease